MERMPDCFIKKTIQTNNKGKGESDFHSKRRSKHKQLAFKMPEVAMKVF
jgi:hypothetical protein